VDRDWVDAALGSIMWPDRCLILIVVASLLYVMARTRRDLGSNIFGLVKTFS
jgi:hypothetical protein